MKILELVEINQNSINLQKNKYNGTYLLKLINVKTSEIKRIEIQSK